MQLEGHAATINPSDWHSIPPDVGAYVGFAQKRQSEMPCPYCREPMMEALPAKGEHVGRIVKILKKRPAIWDVIEQHIPNTYRFLCCYACKQVFTSPQDAR